MKKIIGLLIVSLALLGLGNAVWACEEIDFGSDGTICVDIIQNDDTEYELDVDDNDYDESTTSAYYYILLPNKEEGHRNSGGGLLSPRLNSSNWDFEYDYEDYDGYEDAIRPVKVYAIIGSKIESVLAYYDFEDGDRTDDNGGGGTSNGDLDAFDFYDVEDDTPEDDTFVTVRIEALDEDDDRITDYDETATLIFEKNSDPADDTDVEIQSDDFNEDETDIDSNGELDVDFNNGLLEFEVSFSDIDDYTITVKDGSVEEEQDFNVGGGGGTSNGDVDNFYIYTSPSDPDEDEEATLYIKARDEDNSVIDDYDGSNKAEITIEYKTPSSSTRHDATSTQISIDDETPTFENGIAETDITFKYEYEYQITVTDNDDEDISNEKTFDIGGGGSSNYDADNFYVTTDDSTPSTNSFVDLRIKARDGTTTDTSYEGEVEFIVYYKSSSSSTNWTETSSSTYFEIDSDYEDGYEFDSSDDGYATLSNAIKFKKDLEYKVLVRDKDDADIDGYVLFDLNNEESDVDGFSTKELETVQKIYDGRSKIRNNLEDDYSDLQDDNTRDDLSDTLRDDMKDVLDDDSSREFDDYADFVNAFKERYNYAINNG